MPSPPEVGVAEKEVLVVLVELDVDEVGVLVEVMASEVLVLAADDVCVTAEEALLD